MKKRLLILFLFFTLLNYSQEKKFVFYDATSQIVAEEEYYKKFKTGYSDLIMENSSRINRFKKIIPPIFTPKIIKNY